jgi:gas vesicle protein
MSQNGGDFLKGLIFGGLVGVAIGLLYAPKSGKETREDLTIKADEFISKAKEEMEKHREEYDAAMERIKKTGSSIKNKASEAQGKIGKLAHSGKETAAEKRKRLEKALKAGVAAYRSKQSKKSV